VKTSKLQSSLLNDLEPFSKRRGGELERKDRLGVLQENHRLDAEHRRSGGKKATGSQTIVLSKRLWIGEDEFREASNHRAN